MRLHLIKLLAAPYIVLYIPGSSATSIPKRVQVHRPTTDQFHVGRYDAIRDHRLLRASNATSIEERAPLPSAASASTETMAGEFAMKFLEELDVVHSAALDAEAISAKMEELRNLITTPNAETLHEQPRRREAVMNFSRGPNCPRDVPEQSRTYENDLEIAAPKMMPAVGVKGPTRVAKLANIIKQAHAGPDYFPNPESLSILEDLVGQWSAAESKQYTLLDVLEKIYGGVAKLAPALSKAKLNPDSEVEATRLQDELLMIWKENGKSIDDVFKLLRLSELVDRGMTYEDLDTFERYIKQSKKNPRGRNGNFLLRLAERLNEYDVMKMIMKSGQESPYAKNLLWHRMKHWRRRELMFATIVRKLYEAEFCDSAILDVLSEFYGSEAEYLQALSKAKLDDFGNPQLIRFQTSLVKAWLDSPKNIDDIFNLLQLSESTDDGITKERMNTFRNT